MSGLNATVLGLQLTSRNGAS